ncbi:hypothetical protein F4777DRAFT_587508 [Nemania sp. FL0916]|nr:hypothetical protein F4777DRAFT_587508 [Nemania sp. FL0916]
MGCSAELPSSQSPNLCLQQPTEKECAQIWANTAASWKDSLSISLYVTEAEYLTRVPLAENGGMSTWVLVDRNATPDERQIFCSCETFRKRCLVSDEKGQVQTGIMHSVASVFCPFELRGRGYGTRHMQELAGVLNGWQSEYGRSIGSILYSDIGKTYYAKMGWIANPTNGHYVLPAIDSVKEDLSLYRPAHADGDVRLRLVPEAELEALCLRDEKMIYAAMATPSAARKRVVVLPDLEHMLWHIRKEDFATQHIFGRTPPVKGAIAGNPGKQVWAIWTHRYYRHPDDDPEEEEEEEKNNLDEQPAEDDGGNPLYILRLVVEGDDTANKPHEGQPPPVTECYVEQAVALKAVLQAAQAEAARWRLDHVALWEPSPLVHSLIRQGGFQAVWVERQESAIASTLWFGEDGDGDAVGEAPVLVNNEHYAWC